MTNAQRENFCSWLYQVLMDNQGNRITPLLAYGLLAAVKIELPPAEDPPTEDNPTIDSVIDDGDK